jgi:hypothetical protein
MFSIVQKFYDGVSSFFLLWLHDLVYEGITFVTKKVRWDVILKTFIDNKKITMLNMFI